MTKKSKKKNKISKLKTFAMVMLLLVASYFIQNIDELQMKRELKKLGYSYSENEFLKAAYYNNLEAVKIFVDLGINVNKPYTRKGTNSLVGAVMNENIEMVKLLIDNGADVNALDFEKYPVLYYAYKTENEEIINLLKEHGASLEREMTLMDMRNFFGEVVKDEVGKILPEKYFENK